MAVRSSTLSVAASAAASGAVVGLVGVAVVGVVVPLLAALSELLDPHAASTAAPMTVAPPTFMNCRRSGTPSSWDLVRTS